MTLSALSCSDATAPTPAIGQVFVLVSVDGVPVPIQHDEAYLQIADTMTILAGPNPQQRILEHRVAFELSGEPQHFVGGNTWDLRPDGILEWRCPIYALCNASLLEARVHGDQLRITEPGSGQSGEVYRQLR